MTFNNFEKRLKIIKSNYNELETKKAQNAIVFFCQLVHTKGKLEENRL